MNAQTQPQTLEKAQDAQSLLAEWDRLMLPRTGAAFAEARAWVRKMDDETCDLFAEALAARRQRDSSRVEALTTA